MIRHVSSYMLNYYIPTGLMVIISFAAFVIPASHEGLIGRVASLVTLVLVVMGIFNTAKSNLPVSDCPNYIEIWMIVCILFILAAFAQSIFVFLILRSRILERRHKVSTEYKFPMDSEAGSEANNYSVNNEKILQKIDCMSFIIFAIFFFLFNVSFWLITMAYY